MLKQPLRFFVVVATATLLAACGSCGDPDKDGTDPIVDMGPDVSANNEPDGAPNNTNNADPDVGPVDMAPEDMAPVDSDGDGVLDSEDNCPDVENADQLDRDRDDLGDECDALPYIHDPSNPAAVPAVMENEEELSNDTAQAGLEYDIELPFVARGVVGDLDPNGDLDFYSFEIEEPTALLIRFTASQNIWGGAIVLGMDLPNQNVFRAEIAPDVGVSSDRELFLPYPGRYTIVVTDARNLIESQTDVGGAGLQYAVSVSALPLPAPEPVTLPSPSISDDYDGVLNVYEVAVDGVDGMRVTSTGVPRGENAFIFPIVTFYDADAKLGLAMNSAGQSTQTQIGSLAINLAERDTVLVVEDFSQYFGETSTRIELSVADVSSEPETVAAPADTRDDDVPWLEVGESISATIGQPRTAGPTTLVGDEDFFMFGTRRGQMVRVTVAPAAGSQLEPYVQLVHYSEQIGVPIAMHESDKSIPGESSVVEFIMTTDEAGEVGAYVQHRPNRFSGNPVGGANYGYTVTVEEITPAPTPISTIPGSAMVEFEPGQLGLVSFDGEVGQILTASEESNLISDLRIIDTSTWRVLAAGGTSLTFGPQVDGEYWVDLRDLIGRGTEGSPATVSLDTVVPQPLGMLPATASGVLDVEPRQLYSFSATAGQAIDIRVNAPNFFPAIDLYDGTFQPVDGRFYQDRQLFIPEDGEYVVAISSSGGSTSDQYDYTVGVELIQPTTQSVPFDTSGVLDDLPFATWYEVPVTTDAVYSAFVTAPATEFRERVTFYSETLGYLRSSAAGSTRWTSDYTGTMWVAVEDDENGGDPSYTYDVSFSELTPVALTQAQPLAGQLPTETSETLYTFSLPTGGLAEVTVTPTGDWRPDLTLLTGDTLTRIGEATQTGNSVRYAFSTPEDLAISVRAAEVAQAGALDFVISLNILTPAGSTAEVEPNDTLAEAQDPGTPPVVIAATLAGTDSDRYRVPLVRGQRLWALSTDRNMNGMNRFDARLYLHDATDALVAEDRYSGEGFMPAMYAVEAPDSGEYQVIYEARENGNADGDYSVYLVTTMVIDVVETEPNDDTATAQSLGAVDGPIRVDAFVDGTDTVDVFAVTLEQSGGRIRASLENADPGHTLRLLNSSGVELNASGPAFDGLQDPAIDETQLAAGTYYVEYGNGTASGAADVIIVTD